MPFTPATSSVAAGKLSSVSFGNNADHCQFSNQTRAPKKNRVDPNNIKATYPDLVLGKAFSVKTRLDPNEPLKWHVKATLWPIGLYHSLTRHNTWLNKQATKTNNPVGESLKKGHIPCLYADKGTPGLTMSCSEYTTMAIKVMGQRDGLWGSIKGWMYGVWRIASCNPINVWRAEKNGHPPKDPVW